MKEESHFERKGAGENLMKRSMRSGLWAAALCVLPWSVAVEANACHWLDCLLPWKWCSARTTYTPAYAGPAVAPACGAPACAPTFAPAYAPACAPSCAPACGSCAPVTCSYLPQVCYRTVHEMVPVTSFRPVTSCNPCGGCATTCLQPTTSFVRQVRLIPYTTYRMVPGPFVNAAPLAGCVGGGCGTAVAPMMAMPAASGCCGAAAPSATFAAPAPAAVVQPAPGAVLQPVPGPVPQAVPGPVLQPSAVMPAQPSPVAVVPSPTFGQPATGTPSAVTTPAPQQPSNGSVAPSLPQGSSGSLYMPNLSPVPQTTPQPVAPVNPALPSNPVPPANPAPTTVPANPTGSSAFPLLPIPRLINPDSRTTATPVRQTTYVQMAVMTRPATDTVAPADHGGWRAARD